ncbi:hypothetical protein QE152_g15219 [Popillia japonica]|uniref:Uncharacterized protein n=1 Tax=Popillia japonica TaxID=7064 RepID=A0AAW1L903_POPJA
MLGTRFELGMTIEPSAQPNKSVEYVGSEHIHDPICWTSGSVPTCWTNMFGRGWGPLTFAETSTKIG